MKTLNAVARWITAALLLTFLSACGVEDDDFTVAARAGTGGSISPATQTVSNGDTAELTVTPNTNFIIGNIEGCNGEISADDNTYTTGPITADCTVSVTFIETFTVTAGVDGADGTITPASQTVTAGSTARFTVTPDKGYAVDTVNGCGEGTLSGDTYTTGAINADCQVTVVFNPPAPTLSFAPIKLLHFEWREAVGATHYRLLENPDGKSLFNQVGGDIKPGVQVYDHQVPLYARVNARYILQSCVNDDCYDSAPVLVSGTLVDSIGYIKASNTGGGISTDQIGDNFGYSVSLNSAGDTLAVSAQFEDSAATGIDGDQNSNLASGSGAVYVFTRSSDNTWTQQAYIKASNTDAEDRFGRSVSLSGTGDTLAVGAEYEDSAATGINGNELDDCDDELPVTNCATVSGAVYVFTRNPTTGVWSQQAYIKASNTDAWDFFGRSISLDGTGDTLAVGAWREDSDATGVDYDPVNTGESSGQNNNNALSSGAVYVFTRNDTGWSQQAYIKASITEANDYFGHSVSLSGTGDTLAVGANGEDSADTGINGDQNNNDAPHSGAVYVFTRSGTTWSEQAYIKASNAEGSMYYGDLFGYTVSLDSDGDTLAVSAREEASNAIGINGDQDDNSAENAGAVYVFTHDATSGWSQQAYIKASNTSEWDWFGTSISLSGTGDTLAVGAIWEDSNATGIDGDQANHESGQAGAVYVFTRSGDTWSQQAYVKASNTAEEFIYNEDAPFNYNDAFGGAVSLDGTGDTLAVGAAYEFSSATGVNGDQDDNSAPGSGAVYLY